MSGVGPQRMERRPPALAPNSVASYEARLSVPESHRGARVVDDACEATVYSIYPLAISLNGRAVFEAPLPVAPGSALFEVTPQLRPGDNGILRVSIKTFDVQTYWWTDLKLTTPGLRRRFAKLDLAWARLAMADALPASIGDSDALRYAAEILDAAPLEGSDADLDPVLSAAADALALFAERAAAIKVHIVGHSHIDINWLWPESDTIAVILRDFKSILDMLSDYPEMTFSHSQPAHYEVVRERDPALFQRVLERIQEGRWEPLTMQWSEADYDQCVKPDIGDIVGIKGNLNAPG